MQRTMTAITQKVSKTGFNAKVFPLASCTGARATGKREIEQDGNPIPRRSGWKLGTTVRRTYRTLAAMELHPQVKRTLQRLQPFL